MHLAPPTADQLSALTAEIASALATAEYPAPTAGNLTGLAERLYWTGGDLTRAAGDNTLPENFNSPVYKLLLTYVSALDCIANPLLIADRHEMNAAEIERRIAFFETAISEKEVRIVSADAQEATRVDDWLRKHWPPSNEADQLRSEISGLQQGIAKDTQKALALRARAAEIRASNKAAA